MVNRSWRISIFPSLLAKLARTSYTTFALVEDHVLLSQASDINVVDAELKALLTPQLVNEILTLIPDQWLDERQFSSADEQRKALRLFFKHQN